MLRDIQLVIETRLGVDPRAFGKPLKRSLKGCWSLRIGDYRVIYRIARDTVEIYSIAHRSIVYESLEEILQRLK